jgi:predicted nucleotidyltransferase
LTTKPRTAAGYLPEQVGNVRATCLYVATVLGDLMDDLVVAGGLVPSLLIDQQTAGVERHVGTLDLDVGLALAIFDHGHYQALTERLRSARFEPDKNEDGNPTRQRWVIDGPPRVTVDFLIAPTEGAERPGSVKSIERDFAAIVTPGLLAAFRDRDEKRLVGKTILGETAARDVRVCGPAAFVVLKALAFRNRGEPKDAYDLFYLLRNYPDGLEAVAERLRAIDSDAVGALRCLGEDFAEHDSLGPRRAAEFLRGRRDDELQADVRGVVLDFIEACEQIGGVLRRRAMPSLIDQAVELLRLRPLDHVELLDVLGAQLGTPPATLEGAALADPRVEVVCRPEGMTRWDTEYTDTAGRRHYELAGSEESKSTFVRVRFR